MCCTLRLFPGYSLASLHSLWGRACAYFAGLGAKPAAARQLEKTFKQASFTLAHATACQVPLADYQPLPVTRLKSSPPTTVHWPTTHHSPSTSDHHAHQSPPAASYHVQTDANHDGEIDETELQARLSTSRHPGFLRQWPGFASDIVAYHDRNGDGRVSPAEFESEVARWYEIEELKSGHRARHGDDDDVLGDEREL